ncbi:MAG: hypothetical protein R3B45_16395 [Bdellovibrionota bacterium]
MKYLSKIRKCFIKKDADKEVLDQKKLFMLLGALLFFGVSTTLIFKEDPDSSVMIQTNEPIAKTIEDSKSKDLPPQSEKLEKLLQASARNQPRETETYRRVEPTPKVNIAYKAPQVIERKGPDGFGAGFPVGSNLIGKLLTAIDTREQSQFYKVLLPYGGRSKTAV